jgi:F-type H+-transporting ATPase subunit b
VGLQTMGSSYGDWAQGKIDGIRSVLEASRAEHTHAVKERITSVEKMKDVVSVTEGLFALSKVRSFRLSRMYRTC